MRVAALAILLAGFLGENTVKRCAGSHPSALPRNQRPCCFVGGGFLAPLRGERSAVVCVAPPGYWPRTRGEAGNGFRAAGQAAGGVIRLQASGKERAEADGGQGMQGAGKGGRVLELARIAREKRFQDTALQELVSSGQLVPPDWGEGTQFAFADTHEFANDEVVVVSGADARTRFARVKLPREDGGSAPQQSGSSAEGGPPAGKKESGGSQDVGAGGGGRAYQVEVYSAGGERQVAGIPGGLIGKVQPLGPASMTQLSTLAPPVKFVAPRPDDGPAAGSEGGGRGVVASLRRLVDVDKRSPSSFLPFQPLLSRQAGSGAEGEAQAAGGKVGKGELREAPRRAGRVGTGGWGELDGWWRDEKSGQDVFEVLLKRPLGMDLESPTGEQGVRVSSVEKGSNAERAGIVEGDRVSVPGRTPLSPWREDASSVLAAVSGQDRVTGLGDAPVRLRFMRAPQGATSPPSKSGMGWGEQTGAAQEQDWEVVIMRPLGVRLSEVTGRGVFVEDVVPSGNAERAGLRVGDRVVDSRASPSATPEAVARFIKDMSAASGPPVSLVVQRRAEGRSLMEQMRAKFQLGSIDEALSQKVKRNLMDTLPGALMAMQGDGEADADAPAGSASGVLKINVDLLAYRARTFMRKGNRTEGESLYRECIEMDPSDGRAYLGIAKMFEGQRLPVKAKEMLVAGIKQAPKNAYLMQGLACLEDKLGKRDSARALLIKATNDAPLHAASWVSRGKMEEKDGRDDLARKCYARAATAEPENYFAWHCLAVIEARAGNTETARALFKKCASVNPRNAAVFQAWGVMENKAGFPEEAAGLFQKGLDANPRSTWVLQAWAVSEWDRGNMSSGSKLFVKAIKLRPDDGGLYQAFAVRLSREGRAREARRWFEEGSVRARTYVAIWQAWALMEAEAGDIARARELLQEGVWQAGGSGRARLDILWQSWAILEANQGDVEIARKYFERAVQASAKPAASYLGWAGVEESLGATSRAVSLFERAVAVEEGNSDLWRAYAAFCTRVYGEGCQQEIDVYQRQVVAEIRCRAARAQEAQNLGLELEASPEPGSRPKQNWRKGRGASPGAKEEDENEVDFKAKWAGGRQKSGKGQGSARRGSFEDFLVEKQA